MNEVALVELRRYRLRPGGRQVLAPLFARELAEPQEAEGMRVLGWFTDTSEPDQFVWLRGYPEPDPQARADSLQRFYYGPVWAAHKDEANETMLDSDDVLLLRPARGDRVAFDRSRTQDPAAGLRVTTFLLSEPAIANDAFDEVVDLMSRPGDDRAVVLVTAEVPNLFPGLPVRDEHALVWLQSLGGADGRVEPGEVLERLGTGLPGTPHVATLVADAGSPLPLG